MSRYKVEIPHERRAWSRFVHRSTDFLAHGVELGSRGTLRAIEIHTTNDLTLSSCEIRLHHGSHTEALFASAFMPKINGESVAIPTDLAIDSDTRVELILHAGDPQQIEGVFVIAPILFEKVAEEMVEARDWQSMIARKACNGNCAHTIVENERLRAALRALLG